MKRSLFLLFSFLYFFPALSGWFSSPFSIDYERMANAFQPVIQSTLQQQTTGHSQLIEKASKDISDAFVKGLSEGAGGATESLFKKINENMAQGAAGDSAMRNFFNSIFGHLNNQFAQGDGRNAANNFFATFADQWQEGGQGNRIFTELAQSLGRQFKEEGAVEAATSDFFSFANRRLRTDGEISNLSENFRRLINEQATELRQEIQEGSNIDTTLKEIVEVWPRNFNRVWDLLINRNIAKTGAYTATAIAMFVSGIHGTKLFWKWVEQELFRPKLLIDYDSRGLYSYAKSFVVAPTSFDMIFPQELGQQLNDIAKATRIIHRKIVAGNKNVKYRNLLLWGPPGTGKTMFAKRLAQDSGLAWAHMSGASFSKFKEGEGIQALDDLMKWAKKQSGVLIFIDEAESLISKRDKMDPSSKQYQLLNNFLNYTGERSDRFMLVMATNHKDVIDSAMHRRIDDLVYVPLPAHEERTRVLALYRNKILLDPKENSAEFISSVRHSLTNRKLAQIALKTKGLSNGDLEGIINIIKTDADITESGLVTPALIDRAVKRAIEKLTAFTSAA